MKKKYLKILKTYEWREEEAMVSFLFLDQTKTCYLETKNAYKKKLYSVIIYAFNNNYVFEWSSINEGKRAFYWLFEKYRKDKSYFKKKNKEFKKISDKIKKFSENVKKGISNYSNQELKKLFVDINKLHKTQYAHSLLTESADALNELDYLSFLPEVKKEIANKIIRFLSTPEKIIYTGKERLSALKMANLVFENKELKKAVVENSIEKIKKFSGFLNKLENHTKNYFWIRNGFGIAVCSDSKYFLKQITKSVKTKTEKEINQEIKNIKQKPKKIKKEIARIHKKYKLPPEAKSFFGLIRYFSFLQDRRKESTLRVVSCTDQILNEIEKRFKIQKADLNNYLVSEIIELLEKNKKVSKNNLNKRKQSLFFSYIENNKIKSDFLTEKEVSEIINFFKEKKEKLAASKKMKGMVASMGAGGKIVEGKVRIVFDPRKDIFKKGEILVSGMTRPEFVPLMEKAKAVITNEGGITSHAAIISRELKIPCIIGTKIATDILRDGDCVKLDLKNGIVELVK